MKQLSLIVLCLLMQQFAAAQIETRDWDPYRKEYGMWLNGSVQKDLGEFRLNVGQQLRMTYDQSAFTFSQFELKRKLNKSFSVAAAYRYSQTFGKNNRLGFDLNYKERFKPLTFKFRTRYTNNFDSKAVLRQRVKVEFYNKKTVLSKKGKEKKVSPDLIPYVSAELFYRLNNLNELQRYRLGVGLDYDLSKSLSTRLFGLYQQEMNVNKPEKAFVIGTTFVITL